MRTQQVGQKDALYPDATLHRHCWGIAAWILMVLIFAAGFAAGVLFVGFLKIGG